MSYQLKINKRSLKAAKFISRIQRMLQQALIESGMTQQQVAEKLGVDRSVVNRRLKGKSNLTARSIADFAFVFDKNIEICLVSNDELEIERLFKQPIKVTCSNKISDIEFFHIRAESSMSQSIERFEI
jgi:transcriptional regulator with XRE-family HTH domain